MSIPLRNIRLLPLLPNVTAICQPLDMRFIHYIKQKYKSWLNGRIVDRMYPTPKDKIDQLVLLHDAVPTNIVTYCWVKSGLADAAITDPPEQLDRPTDEEHPGDIIQEADRLVFKDEDDVVILEPIKPDQP